MKRLILTLPIALAACGTASYETVNVRVGNVSCSERFEQGDAGGVRAAGVGSGGGITINAPAARTDGPVRRCESILQIAEATAQAQLQNERLRAETTSIQNRRDRIELEYEQTLLEQQTAALDGEW